MNEMFGTAKLGESDCALTFNGMGITAEHVWPVDQRKELLSELAQELNRIWDQHKSATVGVLWEAECDENKGSLKARLIQFRGSVGPSFFNLYLLEMEQPGDSITREGGKSLRRMFDNGQGAGEAIAQAEELFTRTRESLMSHIERRMLLRMRRAYPGIRGPALYEDRYLADRLVVKELVAYNAELDLYVAL